MPHCLLVFVRLFRRWSVAPAAAIVMVLTVTLLGAAAQADDAPPPAAPPRSAQLTAQLDERNAELAQIQTDLAQATDVLTDATQRIDTGRPAFDRTLDDLTHAQTVLARWSVSAYVSGGLVDADLTNVLLRAPAGGDLAAEGQRAVSVTVHQQLVSAVQRAAGERDRLTVELDRAEATYHDSQQHIAELTAKRDGLQSEITATRAELDAAKAQEAVEAAKAAQHAAEEQLRANTPPPTAVHSGVVPPQTAPDSAIIALGGEIGRTALDAYWHAAAVVNAQRPDCHIDWALIAAIGHQETGHGTYHHTVVLADGSTEPPIIGMALDGNNGTLRIADTDGGALDGDPVVDRAVGPMQFIPRTWKAYAADGNGDGVADPHNLYDASIATAKYLCSSGGGPLTSIEFASRAVFAYNRSSSYNADVLQMADHYRRVLDPSLPPMNPLPTVPVDPASLPEAASPVPPPTEPPEPSPGETTTSTTPAPSSTSTTSTPAPTSTTTSTVPATP